MLRLSAGDLQTIIDDFMHTSEIIRILRICQYVITLHDVSWSDFEKKEEHHVRSLGVTLLKNPLLQGSPEYAIKRELRTYSFIPAPWLLLAIRSKLKSWGQ